MSGGGPPGSVAGAEVLELGRDRRRRRDALAVEEPLELRVVAERDGRRQASPLAVTMRTPGHDFELAAGFLLGEGLLGRRRDVWRIAYCAEAPADAAENIVEVHLAPGVAFDPEGLSRNVYTTSSCGVCGKTSLELVEASCPAPLAPGPRLVPDVLREMPARLAGAQTVFARTGGLHAAAAFAADGALARLREDVGRHNALDKLLGAAFLADELPLADFVVLVSGRASFELVQKALMAGVPVLAAVGAPSSLAVATARRFGMTLIGFLRGERFNVYAGEERFAE